MEDESRYGDSEYSARAEELFALYLARREAGEVPDFETFLDEHPEEADELEGLHADWDNVRGIVARLEEARVREQEPADPPAAELEEPTPAPEPAAPSLAEETVPERPLPETPAQATPPGAPTTEPTVEPPAGPRRRRSPVLVAGLTIFALTAAGLALWALDLHETTRILAAESRDLRLDGERALAELERSREAELRLARRGERLAQELHSAEAGQERLERQLYGVAPLLPAYAAAEEADVEEARRRVAELARDAWRGAGVSVWVALAQD